MPLASARAVCMQSWSLVSPLHSESMQGGSCGESRSPEWVLLVSPPAPHFSLPVRPPAMCPLQVFVPQGAANLPGLPSVLLYSMT